MTTPHHPRRRRHHHYQPHKHEHAAAVTSTDWNQRFADIKAGKVAGLQTTEIAGPGGVKTEAVSNAPVMNGEKFVGGRWVVDSKHVDPGKADAVKADVARRNGELPTVRANLNDAHRPQLAAAPKPPGPSPT